MKSTLKLILTTGGKVTTRTLILQEPVPEGLAAMLKKMRVNPVCAIENAKSAGAPQVVLIPARK